MTNIVRSAFDELHERFVKRWRIGVLTNWFAELIPRDAHVLDVGCGDGAIAALIAAKRPDITIVGVDVLVRPGTHVPVTEFDGFHLPFPDGVFDVVLFSDVLHHTDDPMVLQLEARRVARTHVIIKDHNVKGIGATPRLRFMDRIANSRFGVRLPYNYWSQSQWAAAWQKIGLRPERMITDVGLYPWPVDVVFGAQLQFVARLAVTDPPDA